MAAVIRRHQIVGVARQLTVRALLWASGVLHHVKTPQRFYQVTSLEPLRIESVGWHWFGCPWSLSLLKAAFRLDARSGVYKVLDDD